METIEEIKKKFKDEWVLVEVLEENEQGEPTSKERDETYKAMKQTSGKYVYHFWTGKIPTKGYAVAFDNWYEV